jgi:hypothetical protein
MELIYFAAIVVVATVFHIVHGIRSRSMLDRWAQENGYEIVSAKLALFWWGPFSLMLERDAFVYRISVRDQNDAICRAWARCNGWIAFVSGRKIDVIWD